jgi:serine/threonine protein kinase
MKQKDLSPKAIFGRAAELSSPEERSAYLDDACGNDEHLRCEVEDLLQAIGEAGSFMEHPPVDGVATQLLADLTDNRQAETSRNPTSPRMVPVSLDFLEPTQQAGSLGRLRQYEVDELVGRGGMGIVLRAHDTKLNRTAAIKVLAPELAANATARKRFLREAQAAAAVSHDNLVTIYAVEENEASDDGRLPYLVMEFIDGQSLQEKIDQQGQLELKEVLRIGRQIATGLAAAHEQGLIHRDVKPANILLQNGVERVKITDFGLARAVDDVGMTRTGEVAGTPQFMSPEQAQGHAVDARSDLFSLGSVLYAMCTGRSPFRADTTMASLRRVCDDTPRPIREVNPDVPEWLVEIIDRLLEKKPEDRFQTAAEVAELLSQHLAHLQNPQLTPLPDPTSSKNPKLPRSKSLQRWPVAASILVLVFALATITEATGVTHFAGTVIRLVTGEGTLVIEVDDPSVKVSIDGEQVRITGAGVEELRLRPGRYKVQASKDGKLLKTELVSITRGGRRLVTVTLEKKADVTSVWAKESAAAAEPGAFVVFGKQGFERRFDTLAGAVLGSSPGDTIEIRGNGPFVTEPIEIKHPLTIRAGEGFWPIIQDNSQHPAEEKYRMILARAPLVLEGLEFHARAGLQVGILTSQVSLSATNCRFLGPEIYGLILGNKARLRNCEVFAAHPLSSYSESEVTLSNCIVVGHIDHHSRDLNHEQSLTINDSTLLGLYFTLLSVEEAVTRGAPDQMPIRVQSSGALFDSASAILAFVESSGNKESLTISEAEDWFSKRMAWREENNLYHSQGPYIKSLVADQPSVTTLVEDRSQWNRFWDINDVSTHTELIRYQGGDLRAKATTDPGQLTPEDFQLRSDSDGYQAGPDGRDIGANIDFVGPGEAYERWKQTDEYDRWRKETEALMVEESAKASEPFAVLSGEGAEVGSFATLADAVVGSSPGDTIEIRGNGPFETDPIEIPHPLVIRAGDGCRPVIHATEGRAIDARARLTLEGLVIQAAGEGGFGSLVAANHHVLRAANCRFVSGQERYCLYGWMNSFSLLNCQLIGKGPRSLSVAWMPRSLTTEEERALELRNCLVSGPIVMQAPASCASVALRGNTMIDPRSVFRLEWEGELPAGEVGRHIPIIIDVGESVIHSDPVFSFCHSLSGAHVQGARAMEDMLPKLVNWHEHHNLLSSTQNLLALSVKGDEWQGLEAERCRSLPDWHRFWGLSDTGTTGGTIRFAGGNLEAKAISDPVQLAAEDFRLRPDSAGYQAGVDGKDLGADVDLVGPGKAYERWKQTAAYEQWERETGELIKAAFVAPPSLGGESSTQTAESAKAAASGNDQLPGGKSTEEQPANTDP